MAPSTKKWIDKKSAANFQVRYRSQKDPLIHDEDASDFVLKKVDAPNASKSKVKNASQLERELSITPTSIRANEGEAAMHGIYYDDTEYDYMQHLRGLNEGEAVFIEAIAEPKKKRKQKLEDALRLPKEVLPSEVEIRRTYQDMQDIPDALGGFQPDMDPRLREVLEALEDEEYVDDDEDVFGELAKGGEVDEEEFVEDDGWESDVTEKPANRASGEGEGEEGGWEGAFREFKKKQKGVVFDGSLVDTMSFGGGSSFGGTMSVSGRSRRRRRKNGTESSGYSMSSSALFRTEGLTLLDDRFDKIEEAYAEDEDEGEDESSVSGAPVPETRSDFNSIMDEFLDGYSLGKKGRVRRGKYGTGMDQLDEIRQGLGKARVSTR